MKRSRVALGNWVTKSNRFVRDRRTFVRKNFEHTFMGRFAQQQGLSVHGHGYKGLSWGAATLRGLCSRNDDKFVVGQPAGLPNHAIFGVFDGHGQQGGDRAAGLVARSLHRLIYAQHADASERDLCEEKLKRAFVLMDRHLNLRRYYRRANFAFSGTCAAVVIVGESEVCIANLGDSEVVGKNGRLTRLHNCEDPGEANRIIGNGGFVSEDQRVNGRLIPTRALGDFCLKKRATPNGPPVLTCVPEITRIPRKEIGEFLVIGSDGIFDALTENSVIEYCEENRHLSSKELAERIVDRAIGCGSQDNVTCVVVRLSDSLQRAASVMTPLEDTTRRLNAVRHLV